MFPDASSTIVVERPFFPPGVLAVYAGVWFGALGLLFGSFLNVVIARVPIGRSIAYPGSACPKCGAPIRFYDNVPVLSWVFLGAKCRACKTPISARYPFVELLMGIFALGAYRMTGVSWHWPFVFAFCCIAVALTFIDLDHWLLPHELTWPGIALGLIYHGTVGALPLWESVAGAVAGFGVLWLTDEVFYRLTGKEGIGEGDFFFLAMIGAFLGLRGVAAVVFLASLQGAVIGVALLAIRKARGDGEGAGAKVEEAGAEGPKAEGEGAEGAKGDGAGAEGDGAEGDGAEAEGDAWQPTAHHVPFGPFLALAAIEWLFFGQTIFDWYFYTVLAP